MATTVKTVRTGAFRMESGATIPAWGTGGIDFTSDTSYLFPYIALGDKNTMGYTVDDSIVGLGFVPTPTNTSQYPEAGVSAYAKFERQNDFLSWMFGWNSAVAKAVCFTISVPSVEPVAGAVYTTDSKTFTFVRKEVHRNATYYIFTPTTVAPTLLTGYTLTKSSGTGDATLTSSANSGLMFERIYELDAKTRHVIAPLTAAHTHQASLIAENYTNLTNKNRRGSFAVKNGPADVLVINAMCKKFGLSSTAGSYAKWAAEFCGYSLARGSYGSATWTPGHADVMDADKNFVHHQLEFSVGTAEGSMVDLGVTDLNLGVEIPLQVAQDCVSGIRMMEPVMEGKYKIDLSASLSRHSADTYQDYRDAWTQVLVKAQFVSGYKCFNMLFGNCKISDAGPNDEATSKEPLKFEPGWQATKPFPTSIISSLTQGSPIVVISRDTWGYNPLTRTTVS